MKQYRHRIVDNLLKRKLAGKGAVLIEGPKWCGKTTTAEQMANSVVYMNDTEKSSDYLLQAELNPKSLLFGGEFPRLIDEWQEAPLLWDKIRFESDHADGFGMWILTSSAVPGEKYKNNDEKIIKHTGTGRFGWITMRTMSLWESGESNGRISLLDLFKTPETIFAESSLTLEDIAFLICRGGWPIVLSLPKDIALDQAKDYIKAIAKSDISRVDGVNRSEERTKRLMRSYARHQGTQASIQTICQDIVSNDTDTFDDETAASYIGALKKLFVIEDVIAWNPNIRSKTAIRTSDTRYYIDPSIATASLGLSPDDLLLDLNTMGLFFETLCIRDLKVYIDSINGSLYHYRDKNGLECDAVAHLDNGRYGLIEIKLGGERQVSEGAKALLSLKNTINTEKMNAPSFLMILTATGTIAYRREDGVYVVPIGCLKN